MRMTSEARPTSIFQELINAVTGFPIMDVLKQVSRIGKRFRAILSPSGIYEVLEYESTLELKDPKGDEAHFSKREKVRYLQNNIMAYQDQAWGDGEILLNYHCTPGKAVDFHRPGRKTFILIAIQNIRQFGDQDEFKIEWGMKNCFTRSTEQWETSIDHPTNRIRLNLIFPAKRPPIQVFLIEETRHNSIFITGKFLSRLVDGRWMIYWESEKPKVLERYILQWQW